MLTPQTITSRELSREYKKIVQTIQRTKRPAVLIRRKKPQVAVISMDDFADLQQTKHKNSAQALLDLAENLKPLLKDANLPKDLSTNHDYYLWDEK